MAPFILVSETCKPRFGYATRRCIKVFAVWLAGSRGIVGKKRIFFFMPNRKLSPPKAPLAIQGWETLNVSKSDISNSCPLLEQIKLQQIRLCLPNFAWTIVCCTQLLHSPEVLENRSNRCKFMKSKRRMHNFVCGAHLDPKGHRSDSQLEPLRVVGS